MELLFLNLMRARVYVAERIGLDVFLRRVVGIMTGGFSFCGVRSGI